MRNRSSYRNRDDEVDADRCEACQRAVASNAGFYPDLCLDCSADSFDSSMAEELFAQMHEFSEEISSEEFEQWRSLGWTDPE